ncbi:MAG: hypothetical protein HY721_24380 [Planctomycetes bacterium]|nr:hypothetical protein [Planctomycetota bacterium]
MVSESVTTALASLKAERERLDGAISTLEGLLGGAGGGAIATGRRRGRPPKALAAGKPARGPGGKRKNAPRGLLRETIHKVLKAAGKPLAPKDVRNLVLKANYPNRNPKTLYTAIFADTKKDPAVKKTSAGFSLKK